MALSQYELAVLEECERRGLTKPTPVIAKAIEKRIAAAESDSYLEFLRAINPAGWTLPKHIQAIAEHLDAVTRGEIDRLAIFMPPRHAKTETVPVRYGPYRLLRDGSMNVLITAYNERHARRLSRKARNVYAGESELSMDKRASDEWSTPEGGVLMARGVGSPPTGTGFGLILGDDLIRRREDAESEAYREKAWDWYTDDIYTRQEPGCAIVLTMTLWHEDDVAARAIASEPGAWTILRLAAIAEEDDQLGRAEGEALWPQRYNLAALERIRAVMAQNEGERSWQALFQQNPTPKEGSVFHISKLEIVDAAPALGKRCRFWDGAATAGAGDYTAGPKVLSAEDGLWYIEDVRRGQWEPAEADRQMRQAAELDGQEVLVGGEQEPGASGKRAAQAFVRLMAGFQVSVEPSSGTKEVRARTFAAQVNAGNVRLVRADWNKAYIEELRTFPNGKHDDQVDGSSGAFNKLATAAPLETDESAHASFWNSDTDEHRNDFE